MSDLTHSPRLPRAARALLAALLLLGVAGSARADLLFFKDGFAIQGKVRREGVSELDPVTRELVTIPRGFYLLDDGPRRIVFSPVQVRVVEKVHAPSEEKILVGRTVMFASSTFHSMDPIMEVVNSTAWDDRWERTVSVRTTKTRLDVKQLMAELTPYYYRADSLSRTPWHAAYLTRELGPEVVQRLLDNNITLKETADTKPEKVVTLRMRKVDFYAQAGWFDLAEKELNRLAADQPAQKNRVAESLKALTRLRARDRLEEVKLLLEAGRREAATKLLADFPEADVPESLLSELREVRSRHSTSLSQLKDAKRLLAAVSKDATGATYRPLVEAASAIYYDLHPDNVERLDAFLGQARQAERHQKAGKKPLRSPAELLALAVSGWLLGSPSADYLPERAINLWKTRQMVLAYLRSADSGERKRLLAEQLRAVTPKVELDEVAQMIPHLPPLEPSKETRDIIQQRTASDGRTTYQLALPPEYSHARSYPLLIVLHTSGENALTTLSRWRDEAARNGYILAAPQWERGVGGAYGYTEAEHQAVLDTLKDVRRCYQVDSDRVFLSGVGEGGKMAFDVGLGYPDLFAGVIPMGAAPYYYASRCRHNALYLPFYVVNGSLTGDTNTDLRKYFDLIVPRGYPSLWVTYKGRGQEWFGGEVPALFDWMRRKTRPFPLLQLGNDGGGGAFGDEFTTLRQATNRYYWLMADRVNPRNTCSIERWNARVYPATLTAKTDPDTNEVFVKGSGIDAFSVWVGRTAQGQYTLDLDKPVTINYGLNTVVNKRKVVPSLEVMLEDLYQRGDRKQLFVARIPVVLAAARR